MADFVHGGDPKTLFDQNRLSVARSSANPDASVPAGRSFKDMMADLWKPLAYVGSWDFGKPGDQQWSEESVKGFRDWMDDAGKPDQDKFDVVMAAGWMPKGKIKVNGVETELTKPIDNMLAVFIRDEKGNVEILDPSVKVHGLGELAWKLPLLPTLLDDDSAVDQRWKSTAGVYIATQIVPMAIGGAGGVGVKALSGTEKAGTIARVASVSSKTAMIGGGAQGVASVADFGASLYMSHISDEAAGELAKKLVGALSYPGTLTSATVRNAINDGLHEYSFNNEAGRHIYVPSLRSGEDPWHRLSELLQGNVSGFTKDNNPWQSWQANDKITLRDFADKIEQNPAFMSAYYKAAEKVFLGRDITNQECLLLRVGMSVVSDMQFELEGKNFRPGVISYTAEEKLETISKVREEFLYRLGDEITAHTDLARKMGLDVSRINARDSKYLSGLPSQMLEFPPEDSIVHSFVKGLRTQADQDHYNSPEQVRMRRIMSMDSIYP